MEGRYATQAAFGGKHSGLDFFDYQWFMRDLSRVARVGQFFLHSCSFNTFVGEVLSVIHSPLRMMERIGTLCVLVS